MKRWQRTGLGLRFLLENKEEKMGLFEEDEVMKKEIAEQKAKNARLLGTWVTVMFWFQIGRASCRERV